MSFEAYFSCYEPAPFLCNLLILHTSHAETNYGDYRYENEITGKNAISHSLLSFIKKVIRKISNYLLL